MKDKNNKIKVGKRQKMIINNISKIGIYLDAETGDVADNILVPNNELEGLEVEVGQELNVFIYRDSEDRLIGTLNSAQALVGTLTKLNVVDISSIGAFLDWGLQKDLFLPRDQIAGNIKIDDEILVGLYEDKKGRVTATMNIYKFLLSTFNYEENDKIEGTVYRIVDEIGVFVAVDDRYFGLIPNSECYRKFSIGEHINARVMRVRADGKLDLSIRERFIQQIDKDAAHLLDKIKSNNQILNDKISADDIKNEFQMSKKAFKRAIGNLYKNGYLNKIDQGFTLKK